MANPAGGIEVLIEMPCQNKIGNQNFSIPHCLGTSCSSSTSSTSSLSEVSVSSPSETSEPLSLSEASSPSSEISEASTSSNECKLHFDNDKPLNTACRRNKTLYISNDYPLDFYNILPTVFKYPIFNNNTEKTLSDVSGDSHHSDCSSDDNSGDSSVIKLSAIFNSPCNGSSSSAIICCNKDCEEGNSCHSEQSLLESSVIRFPSSSKLSFKMKCLCRWSGCTEHISSSSKLIEHLQVRHVNTQTFSETFVCLWIGCKVYNRPSCSRLWLERHVISHGGNRPFRCIIDGCGGQRFSSQIMLERHINRHFSKSNCSSTVDTANKLIRRNGQKLRYRRQPFSARGRTDIFDAGIMSQLQYILVEMAKNCERLSLDVISSKTYLHITFQPKVIACRTDLNGEIKYLIRWYPYNALEDEWLSQPEIMNSKSVPLWKLPQNIQEPFWNIVFPNRRFKPAHQSRKYKLQ